MKKQLFFVLAALLIQGALSAQCTESGHCPKEMVERLRQEKQAEREKQKQALPSKPAPEEPQSA